MKTPSIEKHAVYFIVFLSFIFYLPFLSRQFMGDDWMWLSNAKQALIDPAHFFSRAMMGYFRPLNMMFHSLMVSIFGLTPIIFGILSVVLHLINIFVLWLILKRVTTNSLLTYVAITIFGFHCLNYSAIGWISVNHDLFATCLSLMFTYIMINFVATPGKLNFVALVILGISATFFKEFGIVTIGIYFFVVILYEKSPFSKRFVNYTIIIVVTYLSYLVYYYLTTGATDREYVLGLQNLINLWYYIVYLFLPIPKRALNLIPSQFIGYLTIVKVLVTIIIPVILVLLYWKGDKAIRLFIAWLVLFLLPISIFDLGIRLFDLSTKSTISRYMYSAIPGGAIILAAIISKLFSKKYMINKIVLILLFLCYLGGNWAITKKSSEIFFKNQELSTKIATSILNIKDRLMSVERVFIIEDGKEKLPETIDHYFVIEAIIYVFCEKKVDVKLIKKADVETLYKQNDSIIMFYLNQKDSDKCLIPLEIETGIYPAYYKK